MTGLHLIVELVPVRWNVGILVRNAETREPVETMQVVRRSEALRARNRTIDRWSSAPQVLTLRAASIPAWARDRYDPAEGEA